MTFEFAHNFLRKLMNVEWNQLPFLTEPQRDNFFANPHTFFIRADDETARKIWDVLYPKPPVAGGQVVRFPDGQPYETRSPAVDFEYDTGRVVPLPHFPRPPSGTLPDQPRHTYTVN